MKNSSLFLWFAEQIIAKEETRSQGCRELRLSFHYYFPQKSRMPGRGYFYYF